MEKGVELLLMKLLLHYPSVQAWQLLNDVMHADAVRRL